MPSHLDLWYLYFNSLLGNKYFLWTSCFEVYKYNVFDLYKRNQYEISSYDTIYFKILWKNKVALIMFIGCFKLAVCAGKTDLGSLFHCSWPRSETQKTEESLPFRKHKVKPRPYRMSYIMQDYKLRPKNMSSTALYILNVLALRIF